MPEVWNRKLELSKPTVVVVEHHQGVAEPAAQVRRLRPRGVFAGEAAPERSDQLVVAGSAVRVRHLFRSDLQPKELCERCSVGPGGNKSPGASPMLKATGIFAACLLSAAPAVAQTRVSTEDFVTKVAISDMMEHRIQSVGSLAATRCRYEAVRRANGQGSSADVQGTESSGRQRQGESDTPIGSRCRTFKKSSASLPPRLVRTSTALMIKCSWRRTKKR